MSPTTAGRPSRTHKMAGVISPLMTTLVPLQQLNDLEPIKEKKKKRFISFSLRSHRLPGERDNDGN